jgi:hypothetical protein
MFVHSVYFWLKTDLSDGDRQAFEAGLDTLLSIDTIERFYRGAPADTDRPVIDRSYSVGIVVVFRDKAGHDAYQAHPRHDEFRACAKYWEKVLIYDLGE